ncbi:Os02g0795666 [Oryza sativa Japonica Group]|uniref:Os02g0795666 protein n=1 Tax=Oryza sativa subsp. japonica TaxID=39947 RepID=A0A0P0VQL6_ORYSJ|nr:hypothetical protein EE612_014217 [Oryza sativa]BAS81357.1 Os02g0795666 [Oryza sativa Japonica Group]
MKGNNVSQLALLLSYLVLTTRGEELKPINNGENTSRILTTLQVNKTIQVEDGDIYDCVDVNLQPSLKHPLFKGHKIQMEPSSFPIGMDIKSPLVGAISQAQLSTIDCPIGTIPIVRNNNLANMMVQRIGTLANDDLPMLQELNIGMRYMACRHQ